MKMKLQHLLVCSGVLTATVTIAFATINGNYGVNIQFVPPLVSANCAFGRWWNPLNLTCATCFCMTGSLSRCFPQPGCNPNNQTNSSSSTATPSDEVTTPITMGNVPPGHSPGISMPHSSSTATAATTLSAHTSSSEAASTTASAAAVTTTAPLRSSPALRNRFPH